MTIVVLGGAGIVGRLIVRELVSLSHPALVADLRQDAAAEVARQVGSGAGSVAVDVTDPQSLAAALRGAAACVNSSQYYFNIEAMRACLEARVPYLDLGGLFHVTRRQMGLDEEFRRAGLTAVMGMGSCPGVSNVQAGWLGGLLETVESVRIYNGTTPEETDPLAAPYSVQTILDEIGMAPMVFREGQFVEGQALGEEEDFDFPEPIGRAKTHLSLHSEVATIPLHLAPKGIRECTFKITFFGFSETAARQLELLTRLGLASDEHRPVDGVQVRPRRLLLQLLQEAAARTPTPPAPPLYRDVATVVRGTQDGRPVTLRADTFGWSDNQPDRPSPRLVSAAPAIVASWLASGRLRRPGVWAPEAVVDPGPFFHEMGKMGYATTLTRTETYEPGQA
jgi:saccharopine dehydrogenase-like NADP-dependent oxidoreductase